MLTYITSLNPHNYQRKIPLLLSAYRWENCGSENVSNLVHVAQTDVSDETEFKARQTPEMIFWSTDAWYYYPKIKPERRDLIEYEEQK